MVKKKFDDTVFRFGRIHERDRHTDRQTDRHRVTAKAAIDASTTGQKNEDFGLLAYSRTVTAEDRFALRFVFVPRPGRTDRRGHNVVNRHVHSSVTKHVNTIF